MFKTKSFVCSFSSLLKNTLFYILQHFSQKAVKLGNVNENLNSKNICLFTSLIQREYCSSFIVS